MELYKTYLNSPLGIVEVGGSEQSISSLYFIDKIPSGEYQTSDYLQQCITQLEEYFRGERKEFSLKLEPSGTEFQKRVWAELVKIPFGQTISYIELACRLGDKRAVRAVGGANGNNNISIIIPCHRVIGSNGKLVGYGGGLWRKQWLLNLEQSLDELYFPI